MFEMYCLGNGALKCDGCLKEKNWQTLNKLPDNLRKQIQAKLTRIDDSVCILKGRPWFEGTLNP
jgi:hypothetical protein